MTAADFATYIWNAGDARLFIVERAGVIRIYQPGQGLLPTPFLDITDKVGRGNERGLYAIAFDPGCMGWQRVSGRKSRARKKTCTRSWRDSTIPQ